MVYKISVVRHMLKKLNFLFFKSSQKNTLEPDGFNSEFFQLSKKEITPILHKSSDKQEKKLKVTFPNCFYEVKKIMNSKSCQEQSKEKKNVNRRQLIPTLKETLVRGKLLGSFKAGLRLK